MIYSSGAPVNIAGLALRIAFSPPWITLDPAEVLGELIADCSNWPEGSLPL
jgi:hypothetical protein